MTRFLHVANGTCTTDIIAAAGIPGTRSIWSDVLYEGPVPGGLTDEELLEVRARFLAGDHDAGVDPVNDLRRWRALIADHRTYDELLLWFEHDLFDQLNLIQVLTWIHPRVPTTKQVSLICIGSFPGRPGFKGLGELSPSELASLLDTRRPILDSQYALAETAWRSFRESNPEALNTLRHSDTSPLPYLAASLERFLQEYPWTADGLSRSERRLLHLADDGPIQLQAAFPRMHAEETAYYITDGSLLDLATTLARTAPPLVTITDRAAGEHSLRGTITLTEAGRDVLAGRRDRVACGIDRWLGGVHLTSDAPSVWRWDEGRIVQTPNY